MKTSWPHRTIKAFLDAISGIIEDEASLRASSLAFSLLFCAAPMGAMLLGASTLFPNAFSFWPTLYAKIGPRVLPSALDEAAAALKTFAANAENLSLISLAFASVSTLFLSMQIEKCAQACWGRPQTPSDSTNAFARHWLALTLTPCAVALLGAAAYEALAFSPSYGVAWSPLVLLFGFILVCVWALPAGRPPFWAACVASTAASFLCLAIQAGFSLFWVKTQTYGAIYGAAAVFLGALLWVWLFWLAILGSVSVVATLFLGRQRDWVASGITPLALLLDVGLTQSSPDMQEPTVSVGEVNVGSATGLPASTGLVLTCDLEASLLDSMADSGEFFPCMDYESAREDGVPLDQKRKIFAQCMANKRAVDAIRNALETNHLAKEEMEATIAIHGSARTPSGSDGAQDLPRMEHDPKT